MISPRGKPLSPDLRARVVASVAAGSSKSQTANELKVSRATVYRYLSASRNQQDAVPKPKPQGGYRWSKLDRQQIVALALIALENPKMTIQEITREAISKGIFSAQEAPSHTTVYRALKKTRLQHKKATFFDPKTVADPITVLEKTLFLEAQKKNPAFKAQNLLFFDETNVTQHEQQRYAWAPLTEKAKLPRPKGKAPTFNVFLTIGTGTPRILHYAIFEPKRELEPLSDRYEACELEAPGVGVDIGKTESQVPRLSIPELKVILQQHGIKLTDDHGKAYDRERLISLVLQLKRHGSLGMLRARKGPRNMGGPKKPFRSSVKDVVQYWEDQFLTWWEEEKLPANQNLEDKIVVWDNASTHSAVNVAQTETISFFHRFFNEYLGLGGVIFLPPRDPTKNPVELAFAYMKHYVRHWAPDNGYTEQGLIDAIKKALDQITPQMIENWVRKCGYVNDIDARHLVPRPPALQPPTNNCKTKEADLRRTNDMLVCANTKGTVIKTKSPRKKKWKFHTKSGSTESDQDLVDIYSGHLHPLPARDRPMVDRTLPHRWPGYQTNSGPAEIPHDREETRPESYFGGLVSGDVYAVESIIDRKVDHQGRTLYRIRWKGYGPEHDSWEPYKNLTSGARLLLQDFERRRSS